MTETDETASRLRDAVVAAALTHIIDHDIAHAIGDCALVIAALDAYRDHIALVARRDALREVAGTVLEPGTGEEPWGVVSRLVIMLHQAERMLDTEKPAEAGQERRP